MTNKQDKVDNNLVDIYYAKYKGIIDKKYIELYVILGNNIYRSID